MHFIIDRYRSALRGRRQPVHACEYGDILFCVSGNCTLHTQAKDYPFEAGQAFILPAGMAHAVLSDEDFVYIYVRDTSKRLIMTECILTLWDNEENEGRFLADMLFRNRYINSPFVTGLASAYIHFWLSRADMPGDAGAATDAVYRKILDGALEKSTDVTAILDASGYAQDYIRMLFKKRYGLPPVKFLARVRMEHAAYLLDTYKDRLPLAEIADKCGYDDYIYFSKSFKAHFGMSPRAYITAHKA